MCGLSRSANNSPMLEPGAPPAQKSPAPKTFEDKRLDNYNKGQQELERRRQILMEEVSVVVLFVEVYGHRNMFE